MPPDLTLHHFANLYGVFVLLLFLCLCFFLLFTIERAGCLLLPCCRVYISVLCIFLAVPWVGLLTVFVVFTDNAHLFVVKIWNYVTENNVTIILFKNSRAQ